MICQLILIAAKPPLAHTFRCTGLLLVSEAGLHGIHMDMAAVTLAAGQQQL